METPDFKPLRILVVEDHRDTALVIDMILSRRGHAVTVADSMAAARAVTARQEIDLLIADIMLRDGLGYDLVRELKQMQMMKAIALTGLAMNADIAMCLEAGFDRHVSKPFDTDFLMSTIAELASACNDG